MLADHLIVEINADHGVRAEPGGFILNFLQRNLARFAQRLFIAAGPAADDVANAGEKIAEDMRAQDRLAGDDALIAGDGAAFDGGGWW